MCKMPENDPLIPRKWRLNAHGQRMVFAWGPRERSVHTVMKALLWALYLPTYPALHVEVRAGDPRYKPDVVALPPGADAFNAAHAPPFWGEAGHVGKAKIETLARRYPRTHFVIAKWDTSLAPAAALVKAALRGVQRQAAFDLLGFPADSKDRFIDADGMIRITFEDLAFIRL